MNNFDGKKPLDQVTREAAEHDPEEDSLESACPEKSGLSMMSRTRWTTYPALLDHDDVQIRSI